MPCLIKHDKAYVSSPLLEAAAVQVFDYSACFTVVVVTNMPCCLSLKLYHLYFVRLRVGGPIWQRHILTGV